MDFKAGRELTLREPGAVLNLKTMNKTIEASMTSDQNSVSRLAYQLWENAGRPTGRDLEFWLAAEAALRATSSQPVLEARTETLAPAPAREKAAKESRATRGGVKKSWPKPYPNLPKF